MKLPPEKLSDFDEGNSAVQREVAEPGFGGNSLPIGLLVAAAAIVFWAGIYLGMFSGGFSGNVYNERSGLPTLGSGGAAGGAAGETKPLSVVDEGKRYFTQNCVVCHQATGLGVPGQYPPLAKSEFANGGSRRLAMILLKGLIGPVTVEGAQFNGAMPAWEKALSDKKIAAILTYVRQEWGNKAPEIAPEQIAAARKELASRTESWSFADIMAVPADAEMPGGAPPAPAPKKKEAAAPVPAKN